ncbi:MAG: polyprenyl synthetase family protein [Clostridiales Family XIII bacterium]|jgi:geranylgeranyl pyrophosphate synthase|nr:polyprenyl synthetase family protein [Clostridiales Family XIII bacterium]
MSMKIDSFESNKLLAALNKGCYKTAAAETRRALSLMEEWFARRFDAAGATEKDGWIYSALSSGGKRLRPMLVRLAAGFGRPDEARIVRLMCAIELIHSASLVHDDIVDRSPLRRSRATINAEKGDGYAAMCGFAMIGEALALLEDADADAVIDVVAKIPMEMCFGELRQLEIEFDLKAQDEEDYCKRIERKTAVLIKGSCLTGALAAGAGQRVVSALSDYGHALGILFQLRDDLLDCEQIPTDGKPISQDMERGIYSLPILYALTQLREGTREGEKLRAALRKRVKSPAEIRALAEIAADTGGIDYARAAIARQQGRAGDALSRLPANEYTEALTILLDTLAAAPNARGESEKTAPVRFANEKRRYGYDGS